MRSVHIPWSQCALGDLDWSRDHSCKQEGIWDAAGPKPIGLDRTYIMLEVERASWLDQEDMYSLDPHWFQWSVQISLVTADHPLPFKEACA